MRQVSLFSHLKIDQKCEMDVIIGLLPWGDEAFPFHGLVKWGEAGRHRLLQMWGSSAFNINYRNSIISFFIYCNSVFKQQYSIIPGQHLYSKAPWPVILHAALLLKRIAFFQVHGYCTSQQMLQWVKLRRKFPNSNRFLIVIEQTGIECYCIDFFVHNWLQQLSQLCFQ